MPHRYLVIDVSFLCYRAFHTTGKLSYHGQSTGVIFGFLKTLSSLYADFRPTRTIFAFDMGCGHRQKLYPAYKRTRIARHQLEIADPKNLRNSLISQIRRIREEYLDALGFRNLLFAQDFEADDHIASFTKNLLEEDKALIVSGDSDLYQLLRRRISIYNPIKNRIITKKRFFEKYGIYPKDWPMVKAIAGCGTDEIKGVGAVGEGTAIKYIRGDLIRLGVANRINLSSGQEIIKRNLAIVTLPIKGTPVHKAVDDNFSVLAWRDLCKKLGMRSLAAHAPQTKQTEFDL